MARSQSGCGGWPLPIRRGECFSGRRKLPRAHWNERHRVVAENIDHFDSHGVAPWPVVGMLGGCQFKCAVLAFVHGALVEYFGGDVFRGKVSILFG